MAISSWRGLLGHQQDGYIEKFTSHQK